MNYNQLEVGKYYHISQKGFWMIGKVTKIIKERIGHGNTEALLIASNDNDVRNADWSASGRKIRFATQDEIDWLELSITAGVKVKEQRIKEIYQLY